MLRLVLIAALIATAGCTSSGCSQVGPGSATANWLYHASATEQDFRALLQQDGWTNLTKNNAAPGIFLSASRDFTNQTVNATARMGTDRVVGFGLYAENANVANDAAARELLSPLVEALQQRAPTAWGAVESESYSGGVKLCVD